MHFIPQKAKFSLKTRPSVQNMDCLLDLAREQLDLHPIDWADFVLQGAVNLWKDQAYINIQA